MLTESSLTPCAKTPNDSRATFPMIPTLNKTIRQNTPPLGALAPSRTTTPSFWAIAPPMSTCEAVSLSHHTCPSCGPSTRRTSSP